MNDQVEKNLIDFLHFLMISLIVFGFAGNLMCFRIFSSASLKRHPISTFFRTISFTDSIMLVNACITFIMKKFQVDFDTMNVVFCKFRNFLVYANGPLSPWLMVVVSFDRYISIGFPKKFAILFKTRFQIGIICVIILFNYSYYSFMIFKTELESGF